MSRRIDLNRLSYFVSVVESGGFTAAADQLGVTKALVSQQIAKLEAELGISLFTRSTRRVKLTEAGEQFYASSTDILAQTEQAIEHISMGQVTPQGVLRLLVPMDYATDVLAPVCAAFNQLYPAIRIELQTSYELVDLIAHRIDLAIHIGLLQDSTLRATRLDDFERWIVATPDYLAHFGIPATPQDLLQHRVLMQDQLPTPASGDFRGEMVSVRLAPSFSSNSPPVVHAMARQGAGIAALADFLVSEDVRAGRLVRILPDWKISSGGIYALYPAQRYVPAKVRCFIDFFKENFAHPAR